MLISILREKAENEISYTGYTTFINPFSYLMIRAHRGYIDSFDRVHFDGALAVFIFSFLYNKKFERRSFDFTSIAGPLFKSLENTNQRLAVIGSTTDSITKFVEGVQSLYPRLKIVYYRNGYFGADDYSLIFSEIDKVSPDYLLVGMGTPNQEFFLSQYRKTGSCKNAFTCGGFIHQTASVEGGVYYPDFFDKYNLRWVYRIIDEPKLIKRYFIDYPRAVAIILVDYIFSWMSKIK